MSSAIPRATGTIASSSTGEGPTMRIRPELPRSGTFSVSSTSRANSYNTYGHGAGRLRGTSVDLHESPLTLSSSSTVNHSRGDPFLVRVVVMVDNATEPGLSDAAAVKHREAIAKLIRDDNSRGSEIIPGQAVAFAIRKRLKSEEQVAVLNTLTLLDELMRTVPYFYRNIANDKFFRRLWRFVDPDYKSGVKSIIPIFGKAKVHQGMRGSQSDISQRVKILIRAWAEELSVMFNGRYDPDAGFLIERYNNKQARVPFPEVPKTQLPWVCPVQTEDFLRPQNRQRGRPGSASRSQIDNLSLAEVENTVNLFNNIVENATSVNDLREDACTELYARCKVISENMTKLSMNMSKEEELTRAISVSETLQAAFKRYRGSLQTGQLSKPTPRARSSNSAQSEDEGYDDDEYDRKRVSSRNADQRSDDSDGRYHDAVSTPLHLSESSDFSSGGDHRQWRSSDRDYNRERGYERDRSRERQRDWDQDKIRDRPRIPSLERTAALPPLPNRRTNSNDTGRLQRMNSERRTRPVSEDEFESRREKSDTDLGKYISTRRTRSGSRKDSERKDSSSTREGSKKDIKKDDSRKESAKKTSNKKESSKKEGGKKSIKKEVEEKNKKEVLISVSDTNGDISDSSDSKDNIESFDMLAERYSSKKSGKSSKSKTNSRTSKGTSATRTTAKPSSSVPSGESSVNTSTQSIPAVPPNQMYMSTTPGMGMNPIMMMPNPYAMYGSVSPVPMQDPMAMMNAYQTVNPAMYYASMNPHMYSTVTPNMPSVPGTPVGGVISSNAASSGQSSSTGNEHNLNAMNNTPQQATMPGSIPPQSPLPPAGTQSVAGQAPIAPPPMNHSQMGSFYGSVPGGVPAMQQVPSMNSVAPMVGQVGMQPVPHMMFPASQSFTQIPQPNTINNGMTDQGTHAAVYQNAMNQAAAAYHAAASAYQSMQGQAPILPNVQSSAPGTMPSAIPQVAQATPVVPTAQYTISSPTVVATQNTPEPPRADSENEA